MKVVGLRMKRAFETAECEVVRSSIFWELRYEKHENRMKGCDVEQKVSDWQMTAWIYVFLPALLISEDFPSGFPLLPFGVNYQPLSGSPSHCIPLNVH